jgi:transcriptional regulator with XRE-family HTH domain
MKSGEKEKVQKALSKVMRTLRYKKDPYLSQLEVARKTGLSRGTIHGLEQGRKLPSAEVARTLAEYYNVSTDYFLMPEKFPTSEETPKRNKVKGDNVKALDLTSEQIAALYFIISSKKYPERDIKCAMVLLLAYKGNSLREIARRTKSDAGTAQRILNHFEKHQDVTDFISAHK